MPVIRFLKDRAPLEVPVGANLMQVLRQNEIPVASSCGGDGVCVKCRLKIIEGAENLSVETDLEQDLREDRNIPPDERISCQTLVFGDIRVHATYW